MKHLTSCMRKWKKKRRKRQRNLTKQSENWFENSWLFAYIWRIDQKDLELVGCWSCCYCFCCCYKNQFYLFKRNSKDLNWKNEKEKKKEKFQTIQMKILTSIIINTNGWNEGKNLNILRFIVMMIQANANQCTRISFAFNLGMKNEFFFRLDNYLAIFITIISSSSTISTMIFQMFHITIKYDDGRFFFGLIISS